MNPGENPLLGTWKVKSIVYEITTTGEKIHVFGEQPNGYLSYSADGRMYVIFTADNRLKPLAADPTDEQRVKLHRTMAAYAGTYMLEGNKVTHHVDISWNEAWTGSEQVRFFKLDANTLTITTPHFKNPQDGREVIPVLVFEKVKASLRLDLRPPPPFIAWSMSGRTRRLRRSQRSSRCRRPTEP
jgi:Lipocalin-like domain